MEPTELQQKIAGAKQQNLTILDLNRCRLFELPKEVYELTNLQRLLLDGNRITLSAEIGKLRKLESLSLSSNQLPAFPAEISLLQNLQRLILSNNRITAVPAEIGQLTSLEGLNLSNNQLTGLPAEVGALKNLKILNLSNNQLTVVPAALRKLENLEYLDLSGNPALGDAAKKYEGKQNVRAFLVSYLGMDPQGLQQKIAEAKQQNLQRLNLSNNRITGLPAEIGQLENLEGLRLDNNQLTGLPVEIGALKNLKILNLSNNRITGLPAALRKLKNLEYLDLSGNPALGDAAKKYEGTENVQAFLVSYLGMDPQELQQKIVEAKQQNLQRLDFNKCRLVALPAEICDLKNLKKLNLSNNRITALPAEIGLLENLEYLDLSGNPTLGDDAKKYEGKQNVQAFLASYTANIKTQQIQQNWQNRPESLIIGSSDPAKGWQISHQNGQWTLKHGTITATAIPQADGKTTTTRISANLQAASEYIFDPRNSQKALVTHLHIALKPLSAEDLKQQDQIQLTLEQAYLLGLLNLQYSATKLNEDLMVLKDAALEIQPTVQQYSDLAQETTRWGDTARKRASEDLFANDFIDDSGFDDVIPTNAITPQKSSVKTTNLSTVLDNAAELQKALGTLVSPDNGTVALAKIKTITQTITDILQTATKKDPATFGEYQQPAKELAAFVEVLAEIERTGRKNPAHNTLAKSPAFKDYLKAAGIKR